MAFGIVYLVYALNAFVMTIVFVMLLRRYLAERNKLTLLFSLVILSVTFMCYVFIGRGFFEANDFGSIVFYKLYVIGTTPTAALLATFMLYPLIIQAGGFAKGKFLTIALVLVWILTIITPMFVIFGDVAFTYSELNVDIYSVSFGPLSYIAILASPLIIGVLDIFGFAAMAARETESFYRMRAILLMVGWTLSVIGIVIVLSPALLILNPILFGAGAMTMAFGILRKPPS
ncbi:MAG: hypothetical protein P1Q69_17080 [Candidatus Thorarchaeota archaeon]|nr:hypothetical protein [Candidatus Thorarchaeota archaeon]